MPSRESYEVHKEEKSLVQKAKREANQEEILAAALGMKMGPQKPPAAFWQPLKQFAYTQLTSLVRRASLREIERVPKPEKAHNFKVRHMSALTLLSGLTSNTLALISSCMARGWFLVLALWETKRTRKRRREERG